MKHILNIAQIIVSLFLIAGVLLQKGGSQLFGKEARLYRTLRGAEEKMFWATIVLAFIFVGLAVLNLVF